MAEQGWPVETIVLAALAVGLIVSIVNGVVVVKLRVNPIVATLAMLGSARGIAFVVD